MSQSPNVMISAENLTKVYDTYTAIRDINFQCKKGEIVGFLGPNGAGKTTTMRILTGYMPPTSGTATIAGFDTVNDSMEARRHLGYLPETVPLYPEMSVEGYLAYVGRLRRVENLWERVDDVLEMVDLLDRAESHINKLSKGMRQRVGLAQALIHDPAVLILDEPTIGLDPSQIIDVRQLIKTLGQDRTVLLSTHILSEVEQICDRAIIVIGGKVWADIALRDLHHTGGNALHLEIAQPGENAAATLADLKGVQSVQSLSTNAYRLTIDGRDDTRTHIANVVTSQGWGLLEMSNERASLEKLFLRYLREAEALAAPHVEEAEPIGHEEEE
jgi:ABC-2 type transport system ATP-binding protein